MADKKIADSLEFMLSNPFNFDDLVSEGILGYGDGYYFNLALNIVKNFGAVTEFDGKYYVYEFSLPMGIGEPSDLDLLGVDISKL
jgi:hypothetical protein